MPFTKPNTGDPGYSGATKASVVVGGIIDAMTGASVDASTTALVHVSESPPAVHVSPTGDNAFDGRWDRPKLTIASAVSALPAGGGEVLLAGRGAVFSMSSALDLTGLSNITIRGGGGDHGASDTNPATLLQFTQAGAGNCITALGATNVWLEKVRIVYTSGTFTGNVVNFADNGGTPTTQSGVARCSIGGSGTVSANAVIKCDNSVNMAYRDTTLHHAVYGIEGNGAATSRSLLSNLTFTLFPTSTGWPIHNPGSAWTLESVTFEPRGDGVAAGILCDAGITMVGMTIVSPWWGDITGASGVWISGENVSGLDIRGGFIGYGNTTTVMKCTGSSAGTWRGVRISGVRFIDSSPATGTLFDPGTPNSAHDIEFDGNDNWLATSSRAAIEQITVTNGQTATLGPAARSVFVSSTGGAQVVVLPDATKYRRHPVLIQRIDGNGTLTIQAAGGKVNATAGGTGIVVTGFTSRYAQSNGTDWFVTP